MSFILKREVSYLNHVSASSEGFHNELNKSTGSSLTIIEDNEVEYFAKINRVNGIELADFGLPSMVYSDPITTKILELKELKEIDSESQVKIDDINYDILVNRYNDLLLKYDAKMYYGNYLLSKNIVSMSDSIYYDVAFHSIGVTIDLYNKTYKFIRTSDNFINLYGYFEEAEKYLEQCSNFDPIDCELGVWKGDIILSAEVASYIVHEIFGHGFESDVRFANDIGSIITTKVNLNVVDDGNYYHLGYCPIDDEGSLANQRYIIENSKVSTYLTNIKLSEKYGLKLSGNARSVSYDKEPLIRVTNTFLENGQVELYEMFESVQTGIYLYSLSDIELTDIVTIYPELIYKIQECEQGDGLNINRVEIEISEIINALEKIGNDFKITGNVFGGCNKDDQYPLMMSCGSPSLLLKNITCKFF